MIMSASDLLVLAFIASFLFTFVYRRHALPYPPGPRGIPFLGVACEHPKSEFWKTYAQWGRRYGNKGIISFHVLGRRIVVVNSVAVAEDLFNKRSTTYSDRPLPPMAGQLMKREKSMFFISYNDRLKTYRKLLHQSFNATAAQNYWGIQEHEACVLIENISKTPQYLFEHIRRNAAAVTMKIAFGYTIDKDHDHFVTMAEESMRVGSLAAAPGKWLVDSFPILRFLPDWFPGAGFKRKAKVWGHQLYTQSLEPYQYVKHQVAAGTVVPSFTSRLLSPDEGDTPDAEMEDIILWAGGALYAAGADTTVSAVKTFFFVMMLYPEIQRRAQEEVDSVIKGERRLPNLRDRPSLPYLECILKEVLRWASVTPLGLFHATSRDDEYMGYHIPEKTTIIPNLWAMTHDEAVYPDPFTFDPDRFNTSMDAMHPPQRDPRDLAFGLGRRTCAGRHVAESSMFIQMATVLATLDICKAVDEKGEVIEPEIEFTTAIVSHVKPFKFDIKPRSASAIILVEQALAAET